MNVKEDQGVEETEKQRWRDCLLCGFGSSGPRRLVGLCRRLCCRDCHCEAAAAARKKTRKIAGRAGAPRRNRINTGASQKMRSEIAILPSRSRLDLES
jgi:hypothetical protein